MPAKVKHQVNDSEKDDMTAMEKHVAFFDKDRDGLIWPSDTFFGFREIGLNLILCTLAAIVIHFSFSWITMRYPDPFFRIRVRNIHKVKHGSDSEVYTSRGDFDENRFEYHFNYYSKPPHTHLSWFETMKFVKGNLNAFDPAGWFQAYAEWSVLYVAISPKDGLMKKEDVRAVYDGSLFYQLAEAHKKEE